MRSTLKLLNRLVFQIISLDNPDTQSTLSRPHPHFGFTMRACAYLTCLPFLLGGCGFQQYFAKPLDPQAITAKLQDKNTDKEDFRQYLILNGYTQDQLPIALWGTDELTYCALFFHPSLDVARAQWRAAESGVISASARPVPSANMHFSDKDNANRDVRPYSLGIGIDVPLETAGKRDIRIDSAQHLSELAKLEIGKQAWYLRNQIALSLNEYQFNQSQIEFLSKELSYRQEIVAIFEKRRSLGAASEIEVSQARLQSQLASAELNTLQQKRLLLLSNLARNTGLPLHAIETMKLASAKFEKQAMDRLETSADAQTTALLNRTDIRIALERYAIAEGRLKLEIAKQYPDIVISPSYAYEFGDKVWSLGLSGLLTLLNKNKAAIAQAEQLREIEATQFEALQNTVLSEVSNAHAKVMLSSQQLKEQSVLLEQQQNNTQRILRRFSAGEIDRLEVTYAKLEELIADKKVMSAEYQLRAALIEFENTRQKPINTQATNEKIYELAVENH